MTSLASREMTEHEMINTCTAPQMAHLIQVLRQTIRNKDKEIERWVDMVSQLQRDGELDPPEPQPELKPEHPAINGYNRYDYIPVEGIMQPKPEPKEITMKFETINGQLCRMVEPEPLTPEANFPCVVRLIQDDSPMGLYHKDLFGMDKDKYNPKICNEVRSLSDLSDSNRGSVIHSGGILSAQYYHFEIIGYPVADGSAEWAFYQHKQGHVLSNHKHCVFRHKFRSDDTAWECIKIYQDGWIIDSEPEQTVCEFCNGDGAYATTRANRTGYERCPTCNGTGKVNKQPQPAKEQFEVGDWVEFNPGNNPKQVEIVDIDGDKLYYNTRYAGKTIKTHIYASAITRKLDPSEVNVKVTLEGTVSKDYDETLDNFILNNADGHTRNRIKLSTIDPATAKLVKELLKAQEEE